MLKEDLQARAINTIRFLSADAVQQANSGHPGLPMGGAAMAYTVWTRHLRHSPKNPKWADRDRFVLSGGHGSMLLYSLLHLTGYDLSLDEIKNFRQWGSKTPGHPEYGLTVGVETTTGPLGQGFANGVGMAIAEAHLAAEFNTQDLKIIDHYVYGIVTDGDLMEGVASEAASLAGHLRLGKLIYLYDDNRTTIDGSTDITFTEDRTARFEAYGWHVQKIEDGNDVEALDGAIRTAKADSRPSLIVVRTTIRYSGEPLGDEMLDIAKHDLGWPSVPCFFIPDDVLSFFRLAVMRGAKLENDWNEKLETYRISYPEKASELERRMKYELPEGWDIYLSPFSVDEKGMATRFSSGKVINMLSPHVPELFGGSADLARSNRTWIDGELAFQFDTPQGRNFHFGIREHCMGAVINGMAVHGGLRPYGATFLVFSDYMRPAIRVSALSHIPSIWIFTHDGFGHGEDGPTHQPVEHLAALRCIPNLVVLRPADANEALVAWKIAVERTEGPTSLILSRQDLPVLDRAKFASAEGVRRGAYILADLGSGNPELILMASGSEVNLMVEASQKLVNEGVNVRLVSFPSWELFEVQNENYQELVLPNRVKARLAVEAGVAQGWRQWVGDRGKIIAMKSFGASAPAKVLFEKYGFTVGNIVKTAHALLKADEP